MAKWTSLAAAAVAMSLLTANLASIFDGSEELVSIASIPFYTRQVSLPSGGTQ